MTDARYKMQDAGYKPQTSNIKLQTRNLLFKKLILQFSIQSKYSYDVNT